MHPACRGERTGQRLLLARGMLAKHAACCAGGRGKGSPPTCTHLVQALGHKVSREALLEHLLVLEGVVLLRVGHGACGGPAQIGGSRTGFDGRRRAGMQRHRSQHGGAGCLGGAGCAADPGCPAAPALPATHTRLACKVCATCSPDSNWQSNCPGAHPRPRGSPDSNQQSKTSSTRRSTPLPWREGMVR